MARLLVILGCLSIALPPGWYRGTFPVTEAQEAPGCHCDTTPSPDRPSPERCCCCEQNWSRPPLPVSIDVGAVQAGVVDMVGIPPVQLADSATVASYPPLHVLKCVWRC